MTLRSFLSVLLIFFACSTQADDFNNRVDAIFADIDRGVDPGCSVGVVAAGQLIHQAGYGLANLELGVPLDGSHVHRIGSVSKQFTAFSVLLLADEGKINLDDDIRKHLPELLDYGVPVSINSILGHIGGWRTTTTSPAVMLVRSQSQRWALSNRRSSGDRLTTSS